MTDDMMQRDYERYQNYKRRCDTARTALRDLLGDPMFPMFAMFAKHDLLVAAQDLVVALDHESQHVVSVWD